MSQRFSKVSSLRACALLLTGLMLAGCGQTGPLYMPKRPAPPAMPATESAPPAPAEAATPTPHFSTP